MPDSASRGSLWRRWDLHVHTPASILENRFAREGDDFDWDGYATALENSGMAVIGVTDYFTIDGYKRLRDMQAGGRLQGIRLLPNVEFRLDQVLGGETGRPGARLNAHVIFSDELDPRLIEEHFLHDLHFTVEGRPQEPEERHKLKVSNLAALGEELRKQHKPFEDKSALEVGAMQATVALREIKELLKDSRFAGKYVIVLAEIYTSDIPWDGQGHNTRKVLLQDSDMVFSSNPKSRKWHLGQPPYEEGAEAFIAEFKSLKPCIHGSDAHALEDVGKPCIKRGEKGHSCRSGGDCVMRYCWIKADPTFEGFRQLLYEPEARVCCQKDDPTPVKSPHSFDRFAIEGVVVSPELTVTDTRIPLNSQLVAVVGGRGGGKTAFVDLIANSFTDREESDDENSFVRRIAGEPAAVFTTLTFMNGTSFRKEVVDGTTYDESEIVYIPQGDLEKQVTNTAALAVQIDAMILGSAAVADTVKRFELEDAAKLIDSVTKQLGAKNRDVVKLEGAASGALKQTTETAIKRAESSIEDIKKKIDAARSKISPERAAKAEQEQQALGELRDISKQQALLNQLLGEVEETIGESTDQVGELIETINEQLKLLKIKTRLPALVYAGFTNLTKLRGELKDQAAATAKGIEDGSKALAALASEEETLARQLDRKKKAEGELEGLRTRLTAITKAEQQLKEAEAARSATLAELALSIVARRAKYREVIELFSTGRDRLLSDLAFAAEVEFDAEDLLARAEELLDGRSVTLRPIKGQPGVFDELVKRAGEIIATGESAVPDYVTEVDRLATVLRPKLKETRAENPAALHELLFRNYFTFKPSVTYKRLPLGKLSLGQKATVLLKLHLADGSNPILIDSHDDHLDNEFIMDELVEGIRQAKEYRQVILVSNNGNVVVNSDAEQVVLAEHKDATIRYTTGALEDPAMRERLVNVLEGGRNAFNQRGKKYRLQ